MAYRCRSLSQPTFSVFKSAFTKPTVKPKSAPSFRTVTARSPLTTPGQAPLKPFSPHFCLFFNSSNFDRWCLKILNSGRFLKWVFIRISKILTKLQNFEISGRFLSWVLFSLCFLSTQRSLRPGSRRALDSILRAPGRCLRVCFAVQTQEFDFLHCFKCSICKQLFTL